MVLHSSATVNEEPEKTMNATGVVGSPDHAARRDGPKLAESEYLAGRPNQQPVAQRLGENASTEPRADGLSEIRFVSM